MNLFLVDTDFTLSAWFLLKADPRRARKQLLECCQILASVEHYYTGGTWFIRKDGNLYRAAHPNHPITVHCRNYKQHRLCWNIASGFAAVLPTHACSISLRRINPQIMYRNCSFGLSEDYIICRKGLENAFVKTEEEYAREMKTYLKSVKGVNLI